MTAWCHEFAPPVYHSESIVALVAKDEFYERNDTYSKEILDEVVNAKIKLRNICYSKEVIFSSEIVKEILVSRAKVDERKK